MRLCSECPHRIEYYEEHCIYCKLARQDNWIGHPWEAPDWCPLDNEEE